MSSKLNKNIYLFNISLVLLIIGFALHYVNFFSKTNAIGNININEILEEFRTDFENITKELSNDFDLSNNAFFEQYMNANYSLLLYRNDTLEFWSKNDVVLSLNSLSQLEAKETIVQLKKGYYNVINNQFETKENRYTLVGLLPIYYSHEIENKYLQKKFNSIFGLGEAYEFHADRPKDLAKGVKNIKSANGKHLFSISTIPEVYEKYSIYSIVFFALGLASLLIYLTTQALYFINKGNQLIAFSLIIAGIILITMLISLLHFIPGFDDLKFFDSSLYASARFSGSLGDLFLRLVLVTWLAAFVYSNLKTKQLRTIRHFLKAMVFIIMQIFMVYAAIYISKIITSLVIDSTINFDVRSFFEVGNFLNLVIALVCIMLMLATYFFIFKSMLNISKNLLLGFKIRAVLVVIAVPLGYMLDYFLVFIADSIKNFNGDAISLPTTSFNDYNYIFALVLIIAAYIFQVSERGSSKRNLSLNYTFLWLSFSCLFTASFIFVLDSKKEKDLRFHMASQLSQVSDPITEAYLSKKIKLIEEDDTFSEWVTNRFVLKKTLDDYLIREYFQDYVSSFDIKTHIYDKTGKYHIRSNGIDKFDLIEKRLSFGKETLHENLHLFVDQANQYQYLIETEVRDKKNNLIAFLFIEITPNAIEKILVYPELLQNKDITRGKINISDEYSYAFYEKDNTKDGNNILNISQKGDFDFPVNFLPYFSTLNGTFKFIEKGGFSHFIYKMHNNGNYLVLSKSQFNPLRLISLFSLIYLMMVIFMGFVWLVYLLISSVLYKTNPFMFFLSSFRRRVNLSMLALLLFSFLLTGVIITFFLIRQFDNIDTNRLVTKREAVQTSFKNEIADKRIDETNFKVVLDSIFTNQVKKSRILSSFNRKYEIKKELIKVQSSMVATLDSLSFAISKVHGVDINIFNPEGNLIGSSLRTIFDKGLLASKLHPNVLKKLVKERKKDMQQKEKIGEFEYSSAYFQLKDNIDDKLLAIINIPYYLGDDKALQNEVSEFILALVNVYVFLFILGSIIALMLSKTLTNSLTKVGDKMQTFRLGQKHDPIEWSYDDEIGRLITGYNQMITELDISAEMLAQSERQSAWRQMARQVAHEIKNPLTPMKLSIQHLQRALKDNAPGVNELTKKVSKTLVEQIENLANIASVFSSFAKMPQAENAVLNINELIGNVLPLYDDGAESVKINFKQPKEDWLIFSDKNRLVQVFNNLIKNAIQSIPKEREGQIEVQSIRENGNVLISFKDNGSGIPPGIRDKVFTPNFTTKGSGMGLGLAITKQIIEQSDGKITFETAMDEGTTFHIELPIYEDN